MQVKSCARHALPTLLPDYASAGLPGDLCLKVPFPLRPAVLYEGENVADLLFGQRVPEGWHIALIVLACIWLQPVLDDPHEYLVRVVPGMTSRILWRSRIPTVQAGGLPIRLSLQLYPVTTRTVRTVKGTSIRHLAAFTHCYYPSSHADGSDECSSNSKDGSAYPLHILNFPCPSFKSPVIMKLR